MPGTVDYAQLLASLGSEDFSELRPAQEATGPLPGLAGSPGFSRPDVKQRFMAD
jgi:hypothetical protein